MTSKKIRKTRKRSLGLESLEPRLTMSVSYLTDPVLLPGEVSLLMQRASAAANTNQAIIAVVDRAGDILGVRAESGVQFSSPAEKAFAIDGAVAEARTGALFSSDFPNGSPLSSRAIQFISQTTITQRSVQSSPQSTDPTTQGPGLVAPIGVGGLFPPGINNTPVPDLFDIEGTNRDTLMNPGRFNTPTYVPGFNAPISYGQASGIDPTAQPRGIGTLPGGIPLYERTSATTFACVGGIGVFFPGPNGWASYEQSFVPGIGQTQTQRINAPLCLEAEWMAFAAAGGSSLAGKYVGTNLSVGAINGVPAMSTIAGHNFDIPFLPGGISLSGITVDDFGPKGNYFGPLAVGQEGAKVSPGGMANGTDLLVTTNPAVIDKYHLRGQAVPFGWLVPARVSPDGSSPLTVAQVTTIINQGVTEANLDRSQIRLPLGSQAEMALAVSDADGNILGLYVMPNTTEFSIGVAAAKARNTAYYDSSNLQPSDQLAGIPKLTAFTNRTFRFLAEPRYPEGVGSTPGPWSALTDPGINRATAEDFGPALPASVYENPTTTSELAYANFLPNTNFREPTTGKFANNQNGVVFFPGSAGVYVNGQIVGGFGASGDGVNEDDVVTFSSVNGFDPLSARRVDQYFFRSVRLPYQQFPLNPRNK